MSEAGGGEVWIKFRIGAAFDADDAVSRFIVGLSMIGNDLIATNSRLLEEVERPRATTSPEAVQQFWIAAAQYREAMKFLVRALANEKVRAFVSTLPPDVQEAVAALEASCTPWEGSFVKRISKPIRDDLFHYPAPDAEEWHSALSDASGVESGIRVRGRRVGDTRAVFADEVRSNLLAKHLGTTVDDMRENMHELARLIGFLVELSQQAAGAYLDRLPPGTVKSEGTLPRE